MRGGLSGQLRIGAIPTSLPSVSLLTTPLSRSHPGITVAVYSLNSRQIERGLAEFELELGVTYLDSEPLTGVRTLPLYQERYILLTDEDGPFGTRDEVTWADAATLPLCLLTGDMQNRRIVDGIFHEAGAEPKPTIETNSISTLIAHVRDGPWSSVMAHAWLHVFDVPPACARSRSSSRSTTARSGSSGSTAIPSRSWRGRCSRSAAGVDLEPGCSGGDALRPRVDVHAAVADEAAQRDAAVRGELDGERRRRADRDDDRAARDGSLLHELEREPPADTEHVLAKRQQTVEERPSDHLVHRVVTADVLAGADELARRREEARRVEAARRGERGLRLAKAVGKRRDERRGNRQRALDRRRLDGDRLERALAADAARGGRVERPRSRPGSNPARRARSCSPRDRPGRAPRAGAGPPRARTRARAPRRGPESASSPRPAPADPELERLLDGEAVVDLVPARQPEHAHRGGAVGRWLPRFRVIAQP